MLRTIFIDLCLVPLLRRGQGRSDCIYCCYLKLCCKLSLPPLKSFHVAKQDSFICQTTPCNRPGAGEACVTDAGFYSVFPFSKTGPLPTSNMPS